MHKQSLHSPHMPALAALMVLCEHERAPDKKCHSHIYTPAYYTCIASVQRWEDCWLMGALGVGLQKHKHVISDGFWDTSEPWQQSNQQLPRLLSALSSRAAGLFGSEWQVCVNAGADMSRAPICSPLGFFREFSPGITPQRKQFLLPILASGWGMF